MGVKHVNKVFLYTPVYIFFLFGLVGCGASTASLGGFFSSEKKQVSTAVRIDPLASPIQVGLTSARASRCGFYFNSSQLRSTYFAYEAGKGTLGPELQKIKQAYDFTYKTVLNKIKKDPEYCNSKRVEKIRVDLNRHLKGDYTPSPKTIKKS